MAQKVKNEVMRALVQRSGNSLSCPVGDVAQRLRVSCGNGNRLRSVLDEMVGEGSIRRQYDPKTKRVTLTALEK